MTTTTRYTVSFCLATDSEDHDPGMEGEPLEGGISQHLVFCMIPAHYNNHVYSSIIEDVNRSFNLATFSLVWLAASEILRRWLTSQCENASRTSMRKQTFLLSLALLPFINTSSSLTQCIEHGTIPLAMSSAVFPTAACRLRIGRSLAVRARVLIPDGRTRRPSSTKSSSPQAADAPEETASKRDQATNKLAPTPKKSMMQLDEELRLKMEGISGDGGASGVEYEDGKAEGLKRGVKSNMFRVI